MKVTGVGRKRERGRETGDIDNVHVRESEGEGRGVKSTLVELDVRRRRANIWRREEECGARGESDMKKETKDGDEGRGMKTDRVTEGCAGGGRHGGPKIWGTHAVNPRLESYPIV